jgi:O-antigen ligase
VFGVGMNNVKPHYLERVKSFDIARREVHGHLHSSFMQILAMTGILGFTMFSWFWLRLWQFLRLLGLRLTTPWLRGMAGGMEAVLAAFLVSGLTEYSFGDEEVAMLVFFLTGLVASPYLASADGPGEGCPTGNTSPTAAS